MRARWSDFQHTCAFNIDYCEEHDAEVFKTMNSKFFDGEPMIWVAPAQGIYRHNWVKLWMQVRHDLELESCQPPLPVPREGGGATAGAVLTGEITAWLQRVLPGRDGLRTTAHSLKRTCLSWANKRGFDPRDKLILGGHAHDASMADRYGDDFAARPLRLLESLLAEIRSGSFNQMLQGLGVLLLFLVDPSCVTASRDPGLRSRTLYPFVSQMRDVTRTRNLPTPRTLEIPMPRRALLVRAWT